MIRPYFPIAYQSEQYLKAAKETAVNQRRETAAGLQISCSGCEFVNLCVAPFPCKVFRFAPYSALHILRAFTAFEVPVKSCSANVHKRQLRFQLENGKLVSVSVSVFCSSAECKALLLQVLLRRFPKGFFFGTHRVEKLRRWTTLSTSRNGTRLFLATENANQTEFQTRNGTFLAENPANFRNGNHWPPNTPERGQNTPKRGHECTK